MKGGEKRRKKSDGGEETVQMCRYWSSCSGTLSSRAPRPRAAPSLRGPGLPRSPRARLGSGHLGWGWARQGLRPLVGPRGPPFLAQGWSSWAS